MSKFSKGEWSTDWQMHGNGFVRITSTDKSCDEPHVETIADVYIWDDYTKAPTMKGMANARLIAYAPEMYKLLEKILADTQNRQFADENGLIALLNSIDGRRLKHEC